MEKIKMMDNYLITYTGLKKVEVFKTNVLSEQDANIVLFLLSQKFPRFDLHFDLEDCDRILRVEGYAVPNEAIISWMTRYGYQCMELV